MGIGVGLGMARFPFQETDNFWRWVELCEAGGVDSLWQTDRLVSEEPFLECMTALAAIAGATRRLKVGMNVASVALRDPLVLAKQCATIDFLSGGRLLPAFGIGADTAPEWAATGRETRGRGRRTDEALDIISRLWRGERVSTDGEHYRYREAVISPLPVQQPSATPHPRRARGDGAIDRPGALRHRLLRALRQPRRRGLPARTGAVSQGGARCRPQPSDRRGQKGNPGHHCRLRRARHRQVHSPPAGGG
jgi:hypothetical protein